MRPRATWAVMRAKPPRRCVVAPERPRSSSITVTWSALQPSLRARSARSYLAAGRFAVVLDLGGGGLPHVDDGGTPEVRGTWRSPSRGSAAAGRRGPAASRRGSGPRGGTASSSTSSATLRIRASPRRPPVEGAWDGGTARRVPAHSQPPAPPIAARRFERHGGSMYPQHRAHPRQAVEHHREERPVPEPGQGARVDRLEELPRLGRRVRPEVERARSTPGTPTASHSSSGRPPGCRSTDCTSPGPLGPPTSCGTLRSSCTRPANPHRTSPLAVRKRRSRFVGPGADLPAG